MIVLPWYWAKILDPDPNSMYLDPQHWLKHRKSSVEKLILWLNFVADGTVSHFLVFTSDVAMQ